jgi:NAD(P)H-hydrate epimerase
MMGNVTDLQAFFENPDPALAILADQYAGRLYSTNKALAAQLMIPRPTFGHKGNFGHCLVIAGNEGTLGASILCSLAALRTGCGLLTALIPAAAVIPMLSNLPEAMIISRTGLEDLTAMDLTKFDAIAFGPGTGIVPETGGMLFYLLNHYKGKLVIDADGLTILSQNKNWYPLLKDNVILTPHPAEFDRLTKPHPSMAERLSTQIGLSDEYGFTVLVKGHYSAIVTKGNVYFNTTGNNGMATAGSGDVLTGIIVSLCAQGYASGAAAILGTYLHGYAGDVAAKHHSMHSMIASDIIGGIGDFFKAFEKT